MLTLYTSLFTLADQDPSKNHYFYMLLIWLSHVKRFAQLWTNDQVFVLIDTRTADFANQSIFLNKILKDFPCPIQFLLHDPPKTMLDGTLQRYKMFQPFEILLYLDVDILVVKSLHSILFHTKPNSLCVHPEGFLKDDNYGAYLTQKNIPIAPEAVGASSGKFIITNQRTRDLLFGLILREAMSNNNPFYTLDQPYYNACFYALLKKSEIQVDATLFRETLSINLHNMSNSTVLIDCMGEPGNGLLHLHKLVGVMTMFSADQHP